MANDTDMQAVILRLLLGLWDNNSLAVVLVYKKKKRVLQLHQWVTGRVLLLWFGG